MKKQYDFWYSAKQKKQIELSRFNSFKQVLIADKWHEYTEMIETGHDLTSKWDDFQHLGTGTVSNTRIGEVRQGQG